MTPKTRRKIVLGLIILGHQSKEIAYWLGYAKSTIANDRYLLYSLYHVRNTCELIRATW